MESALKIAFRFLATRLLTKSDILRLRPELAKAAQEVYDEWDEDRAEELGHGGICQDIAEKIAQVLDHHGIESQTISATVGDQHVYAIAKVREGVFEIDISPHIYERGGGYNWTKIPNVKFVSDHIGVSMIDKDPEKFQEYTEGQ